MTSPTRITPARSFGVDLLSSPARRTIVDYLANQCGEEGITAAELAEILDIHVTTARFHLDQLVAGGILDTAFVRQGVGRPRKVYSLAPGELREDVDNHAMTILTALLADSFAAVGAGKQLTPFDAGRRWALDHVPAGESGPAATPGAWLATVGRLIDALRDWGYTPHLSTSGSGRTAELTLKECPFIDLARDNPAVVCGIHRGLIAGTLEQFGEDDAEISLEPFVTPQHCVARVTTHTPFTRVVRRAAAVEPTPLRPVTAPHARTPSTRTPSTHTPSTHTRSTRTPPSTGSTSKEPA